MATGEGLDSQMPPSGAMDTKLRIATNTGTSSNWASMIVAQFPSIRENTLDLHFFDPF
jgi:hypothetical protein